MDINAIWATIAPYFSGISVSAIIGIIVGCIIKAVINKALGKVDSKLDIKEISKNAGEIALSGIKNVSFQQSIQPLVESELIKVREVSNGLAVQSMNELKAQNEKLYAVLSALSAYFDDSIMISDSKKAELHSALENMKPVQCEIPCTCEIEEKEVKEKDGYSKAIVER
jgi:hypothetical protein